LPKRFGNEADVSSCIEYDTNQKEDLDSSKTEHTHFGSSLTKALQSSAETSPSTKMLSQVRYAKEKFKQIKETDKKKFQRLQC
jgi:hypothetical protein